MEIFLASVLGGSLCWVVYLCWRFFQHTRQFQQKMHRLQRDMRHNELQLARAIAESGLTGERRVSALERVAEAERKFYTDEVDGV